MSAAGLSDRLRAHYPRSIRARLSFTYAALFLAAGALLLGLTYGLVASTLPSRTTLTRLTTGQRDRLTAACKDAEHAATSKGSAHPQPTALSSACQKLAVEAANSATQNQRDRALHNLLVFSLVGLGVMTVVSGVLGWVMAGRALRPVSKITETARRASERHLGERLHLRGPDDELKELADTFDEMLDRLDLAFATQRRFVADASHELRTPLTVVRTAIDVTLSKPDPSPEQLAAMAVKARRALDQSQRLIESLLTLAMSERPPSTHDVVDLATLAEDALDAAAEGISRAGLEVDARLHPAPAAGDVSLLERLVWNLVDNAVRHNVTGGRIVVRTDVDGASACLEVANDGTSIDEQLVPPLFEPFRRVEERTNSVEGVGLGLAIVQSIATAHHGTVDAHSRPDGGLLVRVDLPIAASP
jgi:signal transduction histidine kinase